MRARLATLVLTGLLVGACATPTDSPTLVNLIGSGLANVEVFTPHVQDYTRTDGSYCRIYNLRQYNTMGQWRYGRATVCRFQAQQWVLAERTMDPWPVATMPAPVPSPSVPVPNPAVPAIPPPPPPPSMGAPGQWTPVTQ